MSRHEPGCTLPFQPLPSCRTASLFLCYTCNHCSIKLPVDPLYLCQISSFLLECPSSFQIVLRLCSIFKWLLLPNACAVTPIFHSLEFIFWGKLHFIIALFILWVVERYSIIPVLNGSLFLPSCLRREWENKFGLFVIDLARMLNQNY